MPFEQQLAIVRVLGRGLSQAAEAMRSMVLELVLKPGRDRGRPGAQLRGRRSSA